MQFFKIDPEQSAKAQAAAAANGVELPEVMKRQLANQFHMLMIVKGFAALADHFGPEVWPVANQAMYDLGHQIGPELYAMLGVSTDDARGLTRSVDVINACLDIVGEEVVFTEAEVVRREHSCLMSSTLKALDGHHYCGMYQMTFRGALHAVTPGGKGGCNNLSCTRSRGDAYCELKVWTNKDETKIPAGRP